MMRSVHILSSQQKQDSASTIKKMEFYPHHTLPQSTQVGKYSTPLQQEICHEARIHLEFIYQGKQFLHTSGKLLPAFLAKILHNGKCAEKCKV